MKDNVSQIHLCPFHPPLLLPQLRILFLLSELWPAPPQDPATFCSRPTTSATARESLRKKSTPPGLTFNCLSSLVAPHYLGSTLSEVQTALALQSLPLTSSSRPSTSSQFPATKNSASPHP